MEFNQELIEKTKEYFWRKHNIGLCDEKAESYLTSLCQFGFLLIDIQESILREPRGLLERKRDKASTHRQAKRSKRGAGGGAMAQEARNANAL